MNKTYICPNMEVVELSMTAQMLAGSVSLDIADDIVDPGAAQAPGLNLLETDLIGMPDSDFPFLK